MRLSYFHLLLVFTTLSWGDVPNVLLIMVDDLKPALGCYGDVCAKTPNLDKLASRGLRFDRAYCNQAVCAPSRFSLMLGSRSSSTGLYGLQSQLREKWPQAVTMPQFFSQHGYRAYSLGKVFHVGHGNEGDAESFNEPPWKDKVIEYLDRSSSNGAQLTREEALFSNQFLGKVETLPRGFAFEAPEAADDDYADGRLARETCRRLHSLKPPFFLAVGFVRPHLPFSVPAKYWQKHDSERLPAPDFEQMPMGAPAVAGKKGGEIAAYEPVPEKPATAMSAELKKRLIHGYYAATSFVDAQIGRVLDELEKTQLDRSTVVVLWGDHGFHLGDHGIWTKHTNYEQANRIPLIIVAPGITQPGTSTKQLTESVDLYPTLAELAQLPRPQVPQPMDGISLVPVLKNPQTQLRDHAYHCYPRGSLVGRAVRSERYRFIEWKKPGAPAETAELELYDYEQDPLETKNLASKCSEILRELRSILARHPEAKP